MPRNTRTRGPASTWFRLIASIALGSAMFLLIWPSFFWAAATPAVLLGAVVWVASGKSRRTTRLLPNAFAGAIIGFFGAGAATLLYVWVAGPDTVDGWEGLSAIVAGVLGALSGAVIGFAVGTAFSFNPEP